MSETDKSWTDPFIDASINAFIKHVSAHHVSYQYSPEYLPV